MRSWWSCAWFLRLATLNCASPHSMGMIRLGALGGCETPAMRTAKKRRPDRSSQENCPGIIGPDSTIKPSTHTKFASQKSELTAGSHSQATAVTTTHTQHFGGTVFPTLCITRRSDWTQKG
jgi:hypothetical protein